MGQRMLLARRLVEAEVPFVAVRFTPGVGPDWDDHADLHARMRQRAPVYDQGLSALINPPPDARNAQPGGYLRERRVPEDPWGHPFQYEMPGTHNTHAYDLWSFGKDGNPGGDGTDADIGNWVEDAQAQAS